MFSSHFLLPDGSEVRLQKRYISFKILLCRRDTNSEEQLFILLPSNLLTYIFCILLRIFNNYRSVDWARRVILYSTQNFYHLSCVSVSLLRTSEVLVTIKWTNNFYVIRLRLTYHMKSTQSNLHKITQQCMISDVQLIVSLKICFLFKINENWCQNIYQVCASGRISCWQENTAILSLSEKDLYIRHSS
jgi:hypothetical protein